MPQVDHLKRVRLDLARDHDFPDGSRERGYDFIAPIDDDGHLIASEWKRLRARCRVRRFWKGQPDEIGHLVHKPGGSWAFHYDVHGPQDDDEAGYRLQTHRFVPGEYISIREHDGLLRTFVVVSVMETD